MTEQMAGRDHEPSSAIIGLYDRWSRGGAGLLITGNVMVAPKSLEHARNVVIEDEDVGNIHKTIADRLIKEFDAGLPE